MGRKRKIPYTLDAGDVTSLSPDELQAILRGADDMILSGGRSLLTKVLKGSKDKKLLGLELDNSPVYGYFTDLTLKAVGHRVDWTILQDYLRIDTSNNLPLLVFSPQGWDMARKIRVDELFSELEVKILTEKEPFDMEYLKDRNREMVLDLLDKVEQSGDSRLIPLLEDWAKIDYKKIRGRIKQVIKVLQN